MATRPALRRRSATPGWHDKVFLVTTGGGEKTADCATLEDGTYGAVVMTDLARESGDMVAMIKYLLQSGQPAGTASPYIYTLLEGHDQGRPCPRYLLGSQSPASRSGQLSGLSRPGGARGLKASRAAPLSPDRAYPMTFRERLQAWRYNLIPDHLIGEILTKRWTDNAIPFLALVVTVASFGSLIPGFFKLHSLQESTRQLGEFSLVVIGLTVVMLGGGIDLAVGSIFALSAFAAVACFFIFELPVWLAFAASLAVGVVFGAINGYLIGYLRLRAFLTTLVTFIIGRAVYDILVVDFASKVQMSSATSDVWDFIGDGTVLGVSVPVWAALALAIVTHVALTRSRPGWHVLAVGGSRRSAYNAGIKVRRTVFLTYVFSGLTRRRQPGF